ncbi:MAG: hypothetical protein EVJ47_02040 [Candidatus Acidulodesulfobacterium ferriphilum]|uniref:Type I restriction enzyme R protein N-terminal domain-containing protein n=1 Tax=Candidatus Acidulodesulfobacterium ferriphilum TaxID=2597223 RepID=A0A519BCS4_9DELT|nr:MAG: hypothetical protein EVJ47_02040 [Candidatus Acidulodesulfobacterium ferriphilum]
MLKGTVENILEKIKKHRSLYEQNEMAVREQVINPLLRSLGWDTENPEDVQPNISIDEGKGIPDYVLIKNDKKVIFIEAKNLSTDIEEKSDISPLKQLARYCFSEGMKYSVLTNGVIWILFRSFEEGTTVSERIVWKTDMESDGLTAVIRKLNTISKESIENIENLINKLKILDEVWKSLIEEPEEIIKGLTPVFSKIIIEGYPDFKFETMMIEDFLRERIKEGILSAEEIEPEHTNTQVEENINPKSIKINGNYFEVRKSLEILTNTAEWLIKKGKLTRKECPIPTGRKRNLINTEPKHRYKDNFRAPKKLSNGLFIETHFSTAGCINNSRMLLEKFGYKGNILEVH